MSCWDTRETLLQHLDPKVLKQHFFFILAFPSDTFSPYLYSLPTHFSSTATSWYSHSPGDLLLFPMPCLLTCGTVMPLSAPIHGEVQSRLYICLHFLLFFLSPMFPCLLSPWPLSRVTAEKRAIGRREDTATERAGAEEERGESASS